MHVAASNRRKFASHKSHVTPGVVCWQVRIRDDDQSLAHFALAVKGAGWTDPDAIPLMVMQSMLGSYQKSAGGGVNLGYAHA